MNVTTVCDFYDDTGARLHIIRWPTHLELYQDNGEGQAVTFRLPLDKVAALRADLKRAKELTP